MPSNVNPFGDIPKVSNDAFADIPVASTETTKPSEVKQQEATLPQKLQAIALGVGDSVYTWSEGITQLGDKFNPFISKERAHTRSVGLEVEQKARKEQIDQVVPKSAHKYVTAGRLASDIGIAVAIPTGKIAKGLSYGLKYIPKVGGVLSKVAGSSVGQGMIGMGALSGLQFTPEGGSKAAQIGSGMVTGGLFAGAGAITGKLVPEIPRVSGKLYKGILSKIKAVSPAEEATSVFGTQPSLSQITGNKVIRSAETLLNRIPGVGMRKYFGRQRQAVVTGMNKIITKAEELVPGFSKETDDIIGVLSKSYDNLSTKSNTLYKEATEALFKANPRAAKPLFAVKALNNAKNILKTLPSKKLLSENTKTFMELADEKLAGIEELGGKMNIQQMNAFRSEMNLEVTRLFKKKGSEHIAKQFQKVVDAIDDDMLAVADKSGLESLKLFTKARQFYKGFVIPSRAKNIVRYIDGDKSADSLLNAIAKGTSPKMTKTVVKMLDTEQQGSLQLALIRRAEALATDKQQIVDPLRFFRELDVLSKEAKKSFTPAMSSTLSGYQKALSYIGEGVQEGGTKLGGMGLVVVGAMASMFGVSGVTGYVALLATAKMLSAGLGTKAGSKVFRMLDAAKPGTTQARDAMVKIMNMYMGKGIGMGTAAVHNKLNDIRTEYKRLEAQEANKRKEESK